MAATDIVICNKALFHVGAKTITTLSDNTAEAVACNLLYDDTRRSLLRAFDWAFATDTVALGTENDTNVSGWGFEYDLPADHLRTIRIAPEAETDTDVAVLGELLTPENRYEIRGGLILCDVPDAWVLYVKDETTTTLFPIDFEDALVLRLAAKLAMPLTGDPGIKDSMMREAELTMRAAMRSSSDDLDFIELESDLTFARS